MSDLIAKADDVNAGLATKANAAATTTALGTKATGGQAVIADLALGSTGVGAVDAVLATAQTKINDVLAKLRASGLILP